MKPSSGKLCWASTIIDNSIHKLSYNGERNRHDLRLISPNTNMLVG